MVENKKKYKMQLLKLLHAFKSRNQILSEEIEKNNEEIKKMEKELSEIRISTEERMG